MGYRDTHTTWTFKTHGMMLDLPQWPHISLARVRDHLRDVRGKEEAELIRMLPSIHHWAASGAGSGARLDPHLLWLPLNGVHHPAQVTHGTWQVTLAVLLSTGNTFQCEGRYTDGYSAQIAAEYFLAAVKTRHKTTKMKAGKTYTVKINLSINRLTPAQTLLSRVN